MMKEKININLTGKEYIDYLKHKEENSLFNKFNNARKETKFTMLGSLVIISVTILIAFLIETLNYVPKEPTVYTWNGIAMFLAICAGIAWVLHGFGFILIRR